MSYQMWTNENLDKSKWPANQTQYMIEIKKFYGPRLRTIILSQALVSLKQASLSQIHPVVGSPCTVMLIENLACPQWLSVQCDEHLLLDIVCVEECTNSKNNPVLANVTQIKCHEKDHILKFEYCYKLEKVTIKSAATQAKLKYLWNPSFLHLKEIQFLFAAIVENISPILQVVNTGVHLWTYTRYYSCIIFRHTQLLKKENSFLGYIVQQQTAVEFRNVKTGNLVYCLELGHFVSSLYFMDNELDCGKDDDSDETMEFYNDKLSTKNQWDCSPFHFKSANNKCHFFTITTVSSPKVEEQKQLLCNNSKRITFKQKDDLISDCGVTAEDEPAYWNIAKHNEWTGCSNLSQLACKVGHPRCYNFSDICWFRLDAEGTLQACRTGTHVQHCKEFECIMKYKCPGSYCVSFSYLCNGKWDCPSGYDESKGYRCKGNRVCTNMFKCRRSQICLHQYDLCDQIPHCPHGDDEFMCVLSRQRCPHNCFCLLLAIYCSNHNLSKALISSSFPYFLFHSANVSADSAIFLKTWRNLVQVRLFNCSVENICGTFNKLARLLSVSASNNSISILVSHCFSNMSKIKSISLHQNKVSEIKMHAFFNLSSLAFLDLSNNTLHLLHSRFFKSLFSLKFLLLEGNPMSTVDPNAFYHLTNVLSITSQKYEVCCTKPGRAICTAVPSWFVSCQNLLTNTLAFSLTIVCTIVLIQNLVSLLKAIHAVHQKQDAAFNISVCFVNMTDLLCGVLLLILFCAHQYYSNTFKVSQEAWRKGGACFSVFFISLLFAFSSTVGLVFLAQSRLMVVLFPLDSQFKQKKHVRNWLISLGVSCLAQTVLLATTHKLLFVEVPSNLCLPVVDPTHSNIMIKFLACLICPLQILSSVAIGITYYLLYISCTKMSEFEGRSYSGMKTQLVSFVLSNCFCWISSSIIFMVCLFISKYPLDLLIWTTVAITPLNSLVNPFIFVILKIKNDF